LLDVIEREAHTIAMISPVEINGVANEQDVLPSDVEGNYEAYQKVVLKK